MTPLIASATLVPVTISVGTFTAMMPEVHELRTTVNDPAMAETVKVAQYSAGAFVVIVGLAASYLTDSPIPAMAALFSVAVLVAIYQIVLRINPEMKGK